jgi:hypothetical protein
VERSFMGPRWYFTLIGERPNNSFKPNPLRGSA